MRLFPFNLLNPIATGDYPSPHTEEQLQWTPEDGMPMGDEPLMVAEEELPTPGLEVGDTPPDSLSAEEFKALIREEIPS